MRVVVVAQDEVAARRLASAWRAAAPGVDAEPYGVGGAPPASPAAATSGGAPLAGGSASDGSPESSGSRTGDEAAGTTAPAPRPVVVAGTRLTVGAPPPESPGPPAPRSALPAAEAGALSAAVGASDVAAAWVDVLDAGTLRAGPVAEAAAAAAPHAVPVVALAGRVEVSRRELAAAGVSGAHEVHDADVARVARSWTPGWA
ncbi:hypothetical protein [Myceligenerans pegani]|uniref:Uncharacterized protein n=1 Tax=Myceligenerans pegani TaxID=2776917 RepID=A0ABR9N010_9MICO|nr:hypothetical protein [Myceligenerans sp. TRM 65318]MBE1876988.1 hypothetical protein [Myceligenerans sp. TRM 65318]MBE3019259.1 hypothetical protein [Myceligenerans sp. TRM 65318]